MKCSVLARAVAMGKCVLWSVSLVSPGLVTVENYWSTQITIDDLLKSYCCTSYPSIFNVKHLLNILDKPGTVLDAGNKSVNKTDWNFQNK